MRAIYHLRREDAWKMLEEMFPDPWKVTAHEFLNFLYVNGYEIVKEKSVIRALWPQKKN